MVDFLGEGERPSALSPWQGSFHDGGGGSEPPAKPAAFSALLDAARQQTEFMSWVTKTVQEHEKLLKELTKKGPMSLDYSNVGVRRRQDKKGNMPGELLYGSRLGNQTGPAANSVQREESRSELDAEHDSHREGRPTGSPQQPDRPSSKSPGEERLSKEPIRPASQVSPAPAASPEIPRSAAGTPSAPAASTSVLGPPWTPPAGSADAAPVGPLSPTLIPSSPAPQQGVRANTADSTAHSVVSDAKLKQVTEDFERQIEELEGWIGEELNKVAGPMMEERIRNVVEHSLESAFAARMDAVKGIAMNVLQDSLAELETASSREGLPPSTPPMKQGTRGSIFGGTLPETAKKQSPLVHSLTVFMKKQLSPLEDAMQELKALPLKVLGVEAELEALRDSVKLVAQEVEEAGGGAAASSPLARSLPKQGATPRKPHAEMVVTVTGGDVYDAEDTALAGAHAPVEAPRERRQSMMTERLGNYSSYMQTRKPAGGELDALVRRVEQLEDSEGKVADMDRLCVSLQDRVRELNETVNSKLRNAELKIDLLAVAQKEFRDEELKHNRTWNLANQVDVIQSLIQQEMRYVRTELNSQAVPIYQGEDASSPKRTVRNAAKSNNLVAPKGAAGSPKKGQMTEESDETISPSSSQIPRQQELQVEKIVKDFEDKIKRLQECYQQCILKIAGLKTANKQAEVEATISLERIRRLSEEVEELVDKTAKQESRIDALTAGGGGGGGGVISMPLGTRSSAVITVQGSTPSLDDDEVMRLTFDGKEGNNLVSPMSTQSSGSALFRNAASAALARQRRTTVRNSDAGAVEVPVARDADVELNTNRIVRLGKKLSDLDGDVMNSFRQLREELQFTNQRLSMMVSFLPKRQRRHVEKITAAAEDDQGKKEDKQSHDRREREGEGKRLQFNEKQVETRIYHVDDDEEMMPWQHVGEPDVKWSWCYQPRNEMGRDLARYFEQLEDEKEEMEREIADKFEKIQAELASGAALKSQLGRFRDEGLFDDMAPSPAAGARPAGGAPGEGSGASAEQMARRIQKALGGQMTALDDKLERMANEVRDLRKAQENDHYRKADREDISGLQLRLSTLEKFDVNDFEVRIQIGEAKVIYLQETLDHLSNQVRKVEGASAQKADAVKAKEELESLRKDLEKVEASVKESTTRSINSNRQLTASVTEVRQMMDKGLTKLEQEKVNTPDHAKLLEKVQKLELSMRDNRAILNDAGASGGQEINAVVKRIILNMEDKLMVLEKKVEALVDSRPPAAAAAAEDLSPVSRAGGGGLAVDASPRSPGRATNAGAQEALIVSLGSELSNITQAVQALKQDINLSKVDMAQISEQGQQYLDLAHRLNVVTEGLGDMDEGMMLSLQRVQVMIAAAARQLVAGSKWVTKETFDLRLNEMRKEYLGATRTAQARVEELNITFLKALSPGQTTTTTLQATLPPATKLPKMVVRSARAAYQPSYQQD